MANRLWGYRPDAPAKSMTIDQVDSKKDESIVTFVRGRWQKRDLHRQALERQWYVNIAQYLGYQYHQYDTYHGNLTLPPAPPYRVRLVCNRLMPIVRKVVSKLLRARPTWVTIPASADQDDIYVAKVATKVLQYYWRYAHLDKLVVDAATWMSTTGNCFFRVVWDAQQGPELQLTDEELAILPASLKRVAKTQGVYLGDLQFDIVTPFELDPDPDALRLEEASHVIHTKARSPLYLEQRYGDIAKGLTADAAASDNIGRYFERRIQSLIGPSGHGPTKNDDEESVAVLTHSLWVRPCKRYPRGFHAIVANDRVLLKGEFQEGMDEIPYVHLSEIPVPGRFWGTCALEQCIPLQADYNRGRSQLVENRNLMSKPKWLVPKGSGIPDSACTSEPGELIFHTPGLAPTPWVPPPMPEYFFRSLEYNLKDLEDVSAIHEVTQARAPSGVRSGTAIAQLQEQDEQMLAPTFLTFERGLSRLGATALKLLANNCQEERIVKIVGKSNEVESLTFTGRNLLGEKTTPGINYFDVECQIGSQLPLSKEQRKNFIVELTNAGILDRVTDRKKILQLLELGTEEPVLNDENLQRQNAKRENWQLWQMVQIEPLPFDDDYIHLDEHTRFELQPEFSKNATPEQLQVIEQHKQFHSLRISQTLMPQGLGAPLGAQQAPSPQPMQPQPTQPQEPAEPYPIGQEEG